MCEIEAITAMAGRIPINWGARPSRTWFVALSGITGAAWRQFSWFPEVTFGQCGPQHAVVAQAPDNWATCAKRKQKRDHEDEQDGTPNHCQFANRRAAKLYRRFSSLSR